MGVRLKDIAIVAGVSESTVSLALNDKKVVNEKTREQIKEIARALGYSPNAIAKSLVRKKSGTIGLVVPDIENPYFGRLVRCVDEVLMQRKYNLIVATSNERLSSERRIVENFISNRVEGVIIAPVNKACKEFDHMDKLRKNDIQSVFVTAYHPGFPSSHVMVNLKKGTFDLVDYLIGLGHRIICFLVGDLEIIPTITRVQGYVKAYEKHDLTYDKGWFIHCSLPNFDQAYHATLSLLKSKKRFDAIITMNDIMALGALRALSEHKIRIPDQVSLAGYDNVIFSSIATIPITTVEQDVGAMAVAAVDMLLGMTAETGNQHQSVLLQPRLIIRSSTGARTIPMEG